MSDEILINNEAMRIEGKDGVFFNAAATFVKHGGENYTFVITAATPEETNKLVSCRADIGKLARTYYGMTASARLDYIERKRDGACYRVHLENLGQGPGSGGEPAHLKPVATRMTQAAVQSKLGAAQMPIARAPTLPPIEPKERAQAWQAEAKQKPAQSRSPKIGKPRL